MKAIRLSQLLWAGLLLVLLFADALAVELIATGPLLVIAVIYLLTSIFALGSNRIVWSIAVAMPVIIGAAAVLNVVAISKEKSQYLDAHAIMYMVFSNTVLFLLPILILFSQFWRHRTELRTLFGAPAAGAV